MGILQFKDENGRWVSVPAVTGERGPQGEPGPQGEQGDMAMAVYDPQGKAQDVFAYADAKATEIKNIIAGGLLQRFVTNDTSIKPTGTYATSTYYNTSYGVKIGYCPDGSVLLSMRGGTTTSYENLNFTLASAPSGVSLTTSKTTWDTSDPVGNLYVCLLTGITSNVTISIAMSGVNGSYDYVTCAITVTKV